MIAAGPPDVLLLSASPARHAPGLRALRACGLCVRHAGPAPRARRMLAAGAEVILVDVTGGAWMDATLVRAVNDAHRESVVLALHEGALTGADGELGALAVDGFCNARDWAPIARLTAASRGRRTAH